jgi:hypothetical protein
VNVEVVLLILRVVTGGVLLAFLGAVFLVLWRDYRSSASALAEGHRPRGRLVVIQAGDDGLGLDAELGETARIDDLIQLAETPTLVGTYYPLLPLTSLGRAATNTIVLHDTFCSQEHALLTRRSGQWWLEDRNSSNGTLLNGEPIHEPVVVSAGDVIGIGQVLLKVELD